MNGFSLGRWGVVLLLTAGLIFFPLRSSWAFLDLFSGPLTVEKEKQIGEEFLLALQQEIPLIEDPFLTSYLNNLGQKLVAQMGPQPFKYKFFIVNDPMMNAFAVPGGYVFIHTGMIRMADREGELAAVVAHEISHIYCRHMAQMMEKSKVVNVTSVIGMLAAIFLGGALAQPILMGSMAAGQSAMLKYSRDYEAQADALGFKWMTKAGYNPRDMVSIFSKMNKQRWLEGGKIPVYLTTHPDVDNRIVELSNQIAMHEKALPVERNNPDFQYFTIKLAAICGNPYQLLRRMTQESARDPKNPAYQYGRALALAKLEKPHEALAAFKQTLDLSPDNHLIKRDLAIFYFDHNQYVEALQNLNELSRRYPQDAVTLYYLGRIYQERKQIDQALPLFEKVQKLNPTFSEVYYYLGTIYGEKGNMGLAHYYLGFHSLKAKALPTALFHFRKALINLPSSDTRYGEVKRQVARLERMRVRVSN